MGITNSDEICLSLDDYIKKRKDEGSMAFLDYRKKDRNIDKDELNADLDEIAQRNAQGSKRSALSKFDRYKYSEDSENEEDSSEPDVNMADISEERALEKANSSILYAKEIQQMDHPQCCRAKKRFTTVESKNGIKVQSQQWRVQKNPEQIENKIKNGRVQKYYKKPNNNTKAGIFVEKGNFTYKFADTPGNTQEDNMDSIVGIVRNKPLPKIIRGNNRFHPLQQNSLDQRNVPVNINVNFDGLFNEMSKCMQTIMSKAIKPQVVEMRPPLAVDEGMQVKIAASDFLEFLKAKRENAGRSTAGNYQQQIPNMNIPNMNIPNVNNPGTSYPNTVNEYIISARTGDGIDMDVQPATTNLPLNLRFA